jgi:hypothetical protein
MPRPKEFTCTSSWRLLEEVLQQNDGLHRKTSWIRDEEYRARGAEKLLGPFSTVEAHTIPSRESQAKERKENQHAE